MATNRPGEKFSIIPTHKPLDASDGRFIYTPIKINQGILQLSAQSPESQKLKERSMSANGAKGVVYIYNGDEAAFDIEYDLNGIVPTPMGGTVVIVRAKCGNWSERPLNGSV